MIFKEWLYYLTDKDGLFYKIVNKTLEKTGLVTPIDIGPDGWQDQAIKYGRNMRYKSVVRSFSNPLRYVKDAARILRELAVTSFESKVFLAITRLDMSFGGKWIHRAFYRGEMDLSQIKSEDEFVDVPILENGLDAKLKNFENTVYSVEPLEEMVNDGTLLECVATMEEVDTRISFTGTLAYIPIRVISSGELGLYAPGQAGGKPASFLGDQFFLHNNTPVAVDVKVEFDLEIHVIPPTGALQMGYIFCRLKADGVTREIIETTGLILNTSRDYIRVFNSVSLLPGEKLFIMCNMARFDANKAIEFGFGAGTVKVSYNLRYPESKIRCMSPSLLGQALVDKIAPGCTFKSDYLKQQWDGLKIASGDCVRGFENALIKTSWSDFITSINAVTNIRVFVIEDTVHVEQGAGAWGRVVRNNLGNARKMTWNFFNDLLFNRIKVGYPDIELEDRNGRYEFNVSYQYTADVTRVDAEMDLMSKYKASMYETEFIRMNLDGVKTTNNSTDNTVYFLHCNNIPVLDESGLFYTFRLLRKNYDATTGLIDPASAYNVEISPKKNLLRHGGWISGCFYFQRDGYLRYQSTDRNQDVSTTLLGKTIKESEDVRFEDLDAPYFIPLQFEAETKIPMNIMDIMEENPDDSMEFEYNGDVFIGFPLEVGFQPSTNAAQSNLLLCSPDTDISKLVY